MWIGKFLKPIGMIWMALNVVDDLSLVMRVLKLGTVLIPGMSHLSPHMMCDVCEDVMADLMKGSEGLEQLPCGATCFKFPPCVNMCEKIKQSAGNSTHFPCIAAGYCSAEGEIEADIECTVAPVLRCVPARYCQRKMNGLKMSCSLKPGMGRWVGMANAAGAQATALAGGLTSQKRCGEEGAGPYCIAEAQGLGKVAEALGHVLSLVYGGYQTVAAIETPGGDDDVQWLTFW
jgi:hypothetical protein